MKKLTALALLLLSLQAFSQIQPRIRLTNWGSSVDINIQNDSDEDYYCSGWVDLSFMNGSRDTQYFHEYVYRRATLRRSIRPTQFNQRVSQVSHMIRCN